VSSERQQFRVLYRDFLFRLVDVELLSAAGDVPKLLGQFGAALAAFSLTISLVTFPALARSGLPYGKLIGAVRLEQEFLIATTMAIAGLFTVLAWNAVFPDRRDSLVLGLLPVRVRTILMAKIAAIGTALGVSIAAVNIFTGLLFPFLATGPGLLTPLRSLGAYWLVMTLAGLFVCCSLLAIEGLASHLLNYRYFIRFSSFLQLTAFFANLAMYFLKPSFAIAGSSSIWWRKLPSFWFCGLLQVLNGDSAYPFGELAGRALWGLAITVSIAAITLSLAYAMSMRRMVEQPDIPPGMRVSGTPVIARLLRRQFDRAILMFTARTLARSRQHRLLLAAYAGIGLAIALAYARDFLYGTPSIDPLYRDLQWNQVNAPFLVGSLVLLFFAVIGARAVFAMPIALTSNWIFRITAVYSPAAYSGAVRKSLYAVATVPIWLFSAALFVAIWPFEYAGPHLAVLLVTGILMVELSLYRFRKVPFACSYLPGKAKVHIRLGTTGIFFLAAANIGVRIEYWALHKDTRIEVLIAILLVGAVLAHRRNLEFSRSPANLLQFEDLPLEELTSLDLRSEQVWSGETAYLDTPPATEPRPQGSGA